jgi:hypothetical protein
VQRAFHIPLLNSKRSPGSIEDPIEEISRDESLVQTQRAEGGRGCEVREEERKSDPQRMTFTTPPLLVGEVKVIMTLLASEENSDRWIEGGGRGNSDSFTTRISPAGKTTEKSSLLVHSKSH